VLCYDAQPEMVMDGGLLTEERGTRACWGEVGASDLMTLPSLRRCAAGCFRCCCLVGRTPHGLAGAAPV
jgi:hypothetical protein